VIDLDDVAGLCPGLRSESAEPLVFRAVIALQRRHQPGVQLSGSLRGEELREELSWRERPAHLAEMEDFNRVTEEGAEAIVFALTGQRCGWKVKRRLQSRLSEGADWLMASGTGEVIVEVGGTDEGDLDALYVRKVSQARGASWPKRTQRAAGVVRFVEPKVLSARRGGERPRDAGREGSARAAGQVHAAQSSIVDACVAMPKASRREPSASAPTAHQG
jgi:hypothetical protein